MMLNENSQRSIIYIKLLIELPIITTSALVQVIKFLESIATPIKASAIA